MNQDNLFENFDASSAEEWNDLIMKDLKGASFETLITNTPEGIPIQPFYHGHRKTDEAGETRNISNPLQVANAALPARNWTNNYLIVVNDEKAANKEALHALNTGADGIIFKCFQIPDFVVLLKDISAEFCAISFIYKEADDLVDHYLNYLENIKCPLHAINGYFLNDVLELRDAGIRPLNQKDFKTLAEQIKSNKAVGFKYLNISASLFHNSGANIIHELSFTLSKCVECLDKLTEEGLSIEAIKKQLVFTFAFGRNFFFEIAKVKAFKLQLTKVFKAYGHDLAPDEITIHAETSARTKSALDFHVNLLRNTT